MKEKHKDYFLIVFMVCVAIAAFMSGASVGHSVGYKAGYAAGTELQAPVNITVEAWSDTWIVESETFPIMHGASVSLPTNNYFARHNDVTVWVVREAP